jgi:FkbM family methyltransferase
VKLLEYDVLDHHHVKLPLNTPEFWRRYETIDQEYMVKREALPYNKASVNLYRMPDMGLEFYGNALTVLTQFILKQYYYLRGPVVQPESGDVCIDGGSCRGEVSLNFAHSVGKEGFVYGFEFVPANLAVFEANLALNPGLAERIEIVPRALWDTSDETLTFSDSGPSSTVNPGNPDTAAPTTRTLAIDDFVEQKGLDRVDFIKMDIEGAEPRALLGAKRTIQRCKPKLAICVYHRKDDFYQIPAIINEIDPEYAFYLDHYTIHREETVLYALHKRALQKTVGR